ncbi:MAG TPA: rhomboid family intramembrane serine protease [Polyangiaceae bacterium]|jgi:membrane associated rhomboid family serine protease
MNGPQPTTFALPKPGRALWAALIAMAVLGIFTAFLAHWVPGGARVFLLLDCDLDRAFSQPWRLLTSGLLTDPEHWSHLLLSMVGLYFLGTSLEKRWGSWRFARFLALAVILGNLTTIAISTLVPPQAEAFHPRFVFGPMAAIAAIAIAWSREYATSTVNLFFVIPVRGKVLFWVTIGFCVLDLIFQSQLPEGVVAPFGGVIAGLLLGGTPSLARTAWLRLKLAVLRRRSSTLRVEDVLAQKPKRRPRAGAPPLRVVPGGLEEVLKKRTPPKDKRYLN